MPRPKPEQEHQLISMRLAKTGVEWLDTKAELHHMTRTDLIRAIFRKAAQDYQKGWRP